MTVNTEGGERLQVSDLSTVKVGKKALTCQRQADSIFLVEWGQLLKLPDSVRDPKVMLIHLHVQSCELLLANVVMYQAI